MNDDELFEKAYSLHYGGQLPQAITLYEQLLNTNPRNERALQYLGLAYAQLGDMANAVLFMKQSLQLKPDNPVLLNNLGNAYKNIHDFDQAISHYKEALHYNKEYAQAHCNLAGVYAIQGNYFQALEHYRQAVHAEPDFILAHFNLGLLLLKNNQLTPAKIQFKNVLALDPSHVEAQFYLGVLELEANRLKEAEHAFQTVLQENENHVQALTNLGVVALKQNNGQLAVDYFTRALTIDNDHIEARNNLAATFIHHDRFENALMHYDVLLQQFPDNSEYLYNSGVAQMALGHLNEAIAHFDKILETDPRHFAALNNLAAIYLRLEDKERAKKLLQQALLAKPDDKSSRHMLNALMNNQQAETSPEYAANLFNNYALYYDQHLKDYLGYSLPERIRKFLKETNTQIVERVLDLGCGTGLSGASIRSVCQELIGVDIAAKMLAQARDKGIYDQLIEDEIIHFLKKDTASYDLIIAADVLPYFGDLSELFGLISQHLLAGAYFIFNTEISFESPWQLQVSARFSHHLDYLKQLASRSHFRWIKQEEIASRKQDGKPLLTRLVILQKEESTN
ncbi:protein with TPR motifs (protein-protein interaction motif) [Legionella quinlivanii]|uniref:Protein with TPR motifs (Protein-protein interaction motif) n=1 Tax=Legionella quinlivanii TaxID=45073 RepID=A0A0W0XYT3_9GAMM|nr:tetratricopeptide repeat protein [Legionella quinlivanii]KTD49722.1 protein with TPR motifs (protein-protein interaction motif) [Legionella quinlivanii]MCW8451916.1 tetratricopeptide repeat protein [Legionella quinlivanii]SEG23346.1 Predicted methyltransferase, contains TPR repeat [Legionella quinlivanii DSM 21216]STY09887.1 protein with TPR motifs (protein-protein interaction motif) [Legionella quinlivanii]